MGRFEISLFKLKLPWLLFGQLLENLCYFLFQHLVTLCHSLTFFLLLKNKYPFIIIIIIIIVDCWTVRVLFLKLNVFEYQHYLHLAEARNSLIELVLNCFKMFKKSAKVCDNLLKRNMINYTACPICIIKLKY